MLPDRPGRPLSRRATARLGYRSLALLLVSLTLFTPAGAWGASHSDAPLIKQDPQANLTDVYAFIGARYDNPGQKVLPPAGPDPGQPDPEQAVRRTNLGPRHHPLVDGELVAQGQVLDGELAVAAEEEGEEPRKLEQEGNHRVEIVPGSEPINQ
jgi:hypothetical protein